MLRAVLSENVPGTFLEEIQGVCGAARLFSTVVGGRGGVNAEAQAFANLLVHNLGAEKSIQTVVGLFLPIAQWNPR